MERKAHVLEERIIGNVRIRLHFVQTQTTKRYCIELSAYNLPADQAKLLLFQGGMDQEESLVMFHAFAAHIRGFDWYHNEFILD